MVELTSTEYKYMCIIWKNPEGIASREIYKIFPQTMGSKSTILQRIVKKGYAISEQKGRTVIYYPTTSRLKYDRKRVCAELEEKMKFSSFSSLVAAFCGKDKLNEDEKQKLDDLIKKLEEDSHD